MKIVSAYRELNLESRCGTERCRGFVKCLPGMRGDKSMKGVMYLRSIYSLNNKHERTGWNRAREK